MSGSSRCLRLADNDDFVARGLIERTIVSGGLFAAGWLLASGRLRLPRIEPDLVRLTGTLLTVLATARLIWFDMLLHNPAFIDQWVGPMPVLNLILPASPGAVAHAARRPRRIETLGPWLATSSPPCSPASP